MLVHAYRRQGAVRTFEAIAVAEVEVVLASVGISVTPAALYERVMLEAE